MKAYLLLIFIYSFNVHANDSTAIAGDGIGDTQPEESRAYGQAVEGEGETGGILDKLRDTEPVKGAYANCKDMSENRPQEFAKLFDTSANPNAETKSGNGMGECIWSSLDDSQKEQVQQLVEYAQEAQDGRAPAAEDEKKQFDSVNLVNTKRVELDPVDEKVKEFFAKKIVDGLYGTDNSKKTVVDHENFYQLYKSRISKNILEAISSFCVEAIPVVGQGVIKGSPNAQPAYQVRGFIIPQSSNSADNIKLRKLARKFNIDNMKEPSTGSDGKPTNLAQSIWTSCMTNIDKVCTERGSGCKQNIGAGQECTDPAIADLNRSFYTSSRKVVGSTRFDTASPANNVTVMTLINELHRKSGATGPVPTFDPGASFTETTGKACQVSQYLKSARQSLKALEKVDEKLAVNRGKQSDRIQMDVCTSVENGKCKDKGTLEDYNSGDEKRGIDAITTLTSKEAVEESGMKDASKELSEEFKKCKDDQDEETCKKFLATNRKEQEDMLAEYSIRSRAMLGKIEKLSKSKDKEGLKQYLKEEGYTEDQITEMTKDDTKVQKLWATIEEKYKNARKNLIDSMKKRLDSTTTNQDGQVVFTAGNNQQDDTAAIDTIAAELTDKTDRYADLVHFNNIVSGYLEVGEGDNAKRNTASMFAELEGASENFKDDTDRVREAASQAGISDTREDENTDPASLGISEINEHILDHETE